MTASADLEGVGLVWLGSPRTQSRTVSLSIRHYGRTNLLTGCSELKLTVGGQSAVYPVEHQVIVAANTPVGELAQAALTIDAARLLAQGVPMELDLCGLRRQLTPSAASVTRNFVQRFDALALKYSRTPGVGVSPDL